MYLKVCLTCVLQRLSSECRHQGYIGFLVPYKCDLRNEEEILAMFAAIKVWFGGVDVCINNAGLAHQEPLLSGKTSGWKNMLDVRELNSSKSGERSRNTNLTSDSVSLFFIFVCCPAGKRSGAVCLHT